MALRVHLQRVRKSTRKIDPLLAESLAELPPIVQHIWQAFLALCHSRVDGPILFSEIEAWQRLTGIQLTAWEFETLVAMDRAALAAQARERAKKHKDLSA